MLVIRKAASGNTVFNGRSRNSQRSISGMKKYGALLAAFAALLCGCTAITSADTDTGESRSADTVSVTMQKTDEPYESTAAPQTDVSREVTEDTRTEADASEAVFEAEDNIPAANEAENVPKLTDDEICALDGTKKGFGQGREVDELNRPLGGLMFNADYSKYGAYSLDESEGAAKQIYLTFDQGYENGFTAPILDTLKEKNVKAVFFLTGDYAKRNSELVQRMIDEGHVLGNHGMKHASIPELSAGSIADAENEIMSLHDYVKETYGYEMKYFRPPCGEYSERAAAIAQRLGYKTIFWSFAYADWDVNNQPDTAEAFERVSGAAHGGGIFLLHSVSETNCTILPEVIDSFREQGFELTVPSL